MYAIILSAVRTNIVWLCVMRKCVHMATTQPVVAIDLFLHPFLLVSIEVVESSFDSRSK